MRFIVFFIALVLPMNASATPPCFLPDREFFVERTLKPANLIILGEILDYSWGKKTQIRILETFYNDVEGFVPEDITISHWQAYDPPLFVYEKKDKLLFYLKKDRHSYILTNASAKSCTPSVRWIDEKRRVSRGFGKNADSFMSLEELREFIKINK